MKTVTYARVQDRYNPYGYHTIERHSKDEPFTFRVYRHYATFEDGVLHRHRTIVEKGVTYYEALSHLVFFVQTY